MNEETILEAEGILITTARFVVGSKTYALRNITSVAATRRAPSMVLPMALLVIGLISMLASVVAGLVLLLLSGVAVLLLGKGDYSVHLLTAAGEAHAVTSENREYIEGLVAALNDAIARQR